MIKKLKSMIFVLALSFGMLVPAVVASGVVRAADIQDSLCAGTDFSTVDGTNCAATTGQSTTGVQEAISTIVDILSWIVGVISVIMIIVGGFRYITSGGASDKVTSAKNTIIYAIIGLIIVALAQFIVNFVLAQAISVDN